MSEMNDELRLPPTLQQWDEAWKTMRELREERDKAVKRAQDCIDVDCSQLNALHATVERLKGELNGQIEYGKNLEVELAIARERLCGRIHPNDNGLRDKNEINFRALREERDDAQALANACVTKAGTDALLARAKSAERDRDLYLESIADWQDQLVEEKKEGNELAKACGKALEAHDEEFRLRRIHEETCKELRIILKQAHEVSLDLGQAIRNLRIGWDCDGSKNCEKEWHEPINAIAKRLGEVLGAGAEKAEARRDMNLDALESSEEHIGYLRARLVLAEDLVKAVKVTRDCAAKLGSKGCGDHCEFHGACKALSAFESSREVVLLDPKEAIIEVAPGTDFGGGVVAKEREFYRDDGERLREIVCSECGDKAESPFQKYCAPCCERLAAEYSRAKREKGGSHGNRGQVVEGLAGASGGGQAPETDERPGPGDPAAR